jgi:hypothetical protein
MILRLNTDYFHEQNYSANLFMERPQVADGEDGLQIWRVAANVLKKPRTADKRLSSKGGVELGRIVSINNIS